MSLVEADSCDGRACGRGDALGNIQTDAAASALSDLIVNAPAATAEASSEAANTPTEAANTPTDGASAAGEAANIPTEAAKPPTEAANTATDGASAAGEVAKAPKEVAKPARWIVALPPEVASALLRSALNQVRRMTADEKTELRGLAELLDARHPDVVVARDLAKLLGALPRRRALPARRCG